MSKDISGIMKRFSGAMIQPVMFLAVGGILLAFASIMRMTFMPGFIASIGNFVYEIIMNGTINNLAVIFCVGLTCALAKKQKADAAVVGITSFLVFLFANNYWLKTTGKLIEADMLVGTGQAMVLGVQVVDMGVFGSLLVGGLNGWLFNKLCDVQFPDAIRIYGGTRLGYLAAIGASALVGIAACYVWPIVSGGLMSVQGFIEGSGNIGLFVYGFLNRLLIPTGLHHLVYMPFCYSSVGGVAEIAGQVYNGAGMIYAAEVGNAAAITQIDPSVKYLLFGFSKIFASVGVVLAFIHTARPERRAEVRSMLIPACITAVVAGITEPLEFMFLFVSPLLFVAHAFLDGLFQVILHLTGFAMNLGNIMSILTSAIIFPAELTRWYMVIPVGLLGIAAWYFVFRFLILKLDLKTPGREDDGKEIDLSQLNAKTSKGEKAPKPAKAGALTDEDVQHIIAGLGGPDNIVSLLNCFTRLRVDLKDMSLLDEDELNKYQNKGLVKGHNNVQIIVGMKVQDVCEAVTIALGRELE